MTDHANSETLIEVKDLKMYFPVTKGIVLRRKIGDVKAVDGLTFSIRKGETVRVWQIHHWPRIDSALQTHHW